MSKEKIIIALDGYSSSGKSTVAKSVAKRLGYLFIDTGAMYRAVTLFALREGLVEEAGALVSRLGEVDITFVYNEELSRQQIFLGGENVDQQIRTMAVSNAVSVVSQIREVREKLVAIQQKIGERGGVVMDGRDIGTVVFPRAQIKIFMTASVEVRAQRRYLELTSMGNSEVSYQEIAENIAQRDHQDMTRKESPLRKAEDAIEIDNSEMTIEEQVDWILELAQELGVC